MDERIAIAGSGAIACGLAAVATRLGDVRLLARSEDSAARARQSIARHAERLGDAMGPGAVLVTTDAGELREATVLVEAVAEDLVAKAGVLGTLGGAARPDALLATTTSSLSVGALGVSTGAPDRFFGLHVFNPVPRMELVELAFGPQAAAATRQRAVSLTVALGKTPVVVPDTPGFVVNRLLFPYLFSAVALLHESGMSPEDLDRCMTLGAGHPMGPLALLDFIGLDIAAAIGSEIGHPAPPALRSLVAEGALGRKSGRGFYTY
ncbi:MAG TPA: 3-hydroxyacyl-CoA dehydrogenase family protein [Solirubrobacteraceae bacterium]|nr:3-hydroxyacyl-CoA dehydrogenase family protein [Solirubrobacteraceae bacterium]